MWPSARICISAKAKARPRKTAPASGPPAACRIIAPWVTWKAPYGISAPCRISTARSASSAIVPGAGKSTWPRARCKGIDAAVDCYGGGVGAGPEGLTPRQPVDPLDYTKDLRCPLLGLFGREDKRPSPEHVAKTEAELKKWGKTYEFHTYDNAGHSFFSVDRPDYRPEAAVDGWKKVFQWFGKYLR